MFSAIPWDSAFVASSNSTLGTDPDSILTWIPPACSVLGNMHVSQIVFTVVLPLLIYWKADQEKHESLMGANERSSTYLLYGKYLVLHAIKVSHSADHVINCCDYMLKITIILFIPAAGLHAVCCVATPSFNGVEDLRSKINF